MDTSAAEQRAAATAQERSAAAAAVIPKLTDEFLDALALAAIAMDGEDRAAGITFTLACHELAGKEPPDFGRFSETDDPIEMDADDDRGWASLRKANPINVVLPLTRKWLDGLPSDVRPDVLAEHFPRIVNLIALEWSNLPATRRLLDDYVIDRRGGRRGFPVRVAQELKALRHYVYTRIK